MKLRVITLIKIVVHILLISLVSCKPNSNGSNFVELNILDTPKLIKGELLEFHQLSTPIKLAYLDPYLFLMDTKIDKYVHVIDLNNNKYLNSLGSRGKGPGEILSAFSLDINNNSLWVHDIVLRKMVSFSLDSIKSKTYKYNNEISFVNRAGRNLNPKWLDGSKIVSTTLSDSQNRLMITDTNGEIIEEKFSMFAPPSKNTPLSIHNQSYQSVLKIKPNNSSKIVLVNRYADLIEIYDLKSNTSRLIKTHENYEPIYEVINVDGNVRMGQDETMRFGYIDVSVSDNKIYTLFSGRTQGENKPNYGDKIYIYDWNGNYVDSYQLENKAIALELIDEKNFLTIESIQGKLKLKKYKH